MAANNDAGAALAQLISFLLCLLRMTQRTPRRYDGIVSPSQKLGDLLPGFLEKVGAKAHQEHLLVFQAWKELLGEKMAPLTEPLTWQEGVLTVKVKSATLYSLLCRHEGSRLLKEMQKKFLIRKITFRV